MRARRRRADYKTASSCCPICSKVFPSVRNQDPSYHELMVVRHITKCSADPSTDDVADDDGDNGRIQSSKKPAASRKLFVTKNESADADAEAGAILEPVISHTPAVTLSPPTPATITPPAPPFMVPSSLSICTSVPLPNDNLLNVREKVRRLLEQRRSGVSNEKTDCKPTIVVGETLKTKSIARKCGAEIASPPQEPPEMSRARGEAPTPVSRPASFRRVAPTEPTSFPQSISSPSAMCCPVCAKSFPRMTFYDQEDYEQMILQHVLSCSKQNGPSSKGSFPKKEPASTKNPPPKSSKKHSRSSDGDGSTTSDTSSFTEASKSSTSTSPSTIHNPAASEKEKKGATTASDTADLQPPAKKPRVIVDPGHFLAQTWWREKVKRSRPTGPTVAFNLQQCVVVDTGSAKNNRSRTRGSTRAGSTSDTGPRLKLCCPICSHEFTADWLGSITEESMRRHVNKCTQKMFETRINLSDLAPNSSLRAQGGWPEDFDDYRRHHRPRTLTDAERARRNDRFAARARGMKTIVNNDRARSVMTEAFFVSDHSQQCQRPDTRHSENERKEEGNR